MRRLWFLLDALNTRTKLVALLLFVIVPYSGLLIYSTYDRYHLLKREVQSQTLHLAQAVADSQRELITHTFQLLEALKNEDAIQAQDWEVCNAMLPSFLRYFKQTYSNFHVANAKGDVVCSGIHLSSSVHIGDRKDFQHVLLNRQAVVGDLVLSRTSGIFSLMIRAPVLDKQGEVASIISAQVSADQFSAAVSTVPLPRDGELIIADRSGKIVVHQPESADWAGSTLPNRLSSIMTASASEIIEAQGLDGVLRIYGVSNVGNGSDNGLRVAIGFPKSEIEKELNQNLLRNISTMLLVIVMVLISAWFGVDALVLRKIKVLIDTIQRLKEGETSARTGLKYGVDELSHIARAIDEAAEGLERLLNLLREQTIHDPLTSLYNRRFLDESLKRELSKAERNEKPVGMIMIDIDHFKKINDTHGHHIGDVVLVAVAKSLLENVRTGDIVCRFGGEEFAILLPGANLNITKGRAEALRGVIEKINFLDLGETIGSVTISLGAAVFPEHGSDAATLLQSADAALYAAKAGGRNQTMVATPSLVNS
jgi:diguanylate cyclase (GGDEF)-like protein